MNSLFENLLNRTVQGHNAPGRGQHDNGNNDLDNNAQKKRHAGLSGAIRPMSRYSFETSNRKSVIDADQEERLIDGKQLLTDKPKISRQEKKSESIDVSLAQNFNDENQVQDDNISNERLEALLENRLFKYKQQSHAQSPSVAGSDVKNRRIKNVVSSQNDSKQHKAASVNTTPVTYKYTKLHDKSDGLIGNQSAQIKHDLDNSQAVKSVSKKAIEGTKEAVGSFRDFDSFQNLIAIHAAQPAKTDLLPEEQSDLNSVNNINTLSGKHKNHIQAGSRTRLSVPEKINTSHQLGENIIDVSINIGRVEIRAVNKSDIKAMPDSMESMHSKQTSLPEMTLDTYLTKRDGGNL